MTTKNSGAKTAPVATDDVPHSWRWDSPCKLSGYMTSISRITMPGIDGEPFTYPVLTVIPDGQEEPVEVHAFSSTLLRKLKEAKPAVGDHIVIDYKGQKRTKAGPLARIFDDVIVNGDVPAFDWDDSPGF